jgi:hypothetical protein
VGSDGAIRGFQVKYGLSPYGVAAMSALTGLFSKQATEQLREVFETLFRTQQKVERKDAVPRTNAPGPGDASVEVGKAEAAGAGS